MRVPDLPQEAEYVVGPWKHSEKGLHAGPLLAEVSWPLHSWGSWSNLALCCKDIYMNQILKELRLIEMIFNSASAITA